MKNLFSVYLLSLMPFLAFSQEVIDVTDQNLSVETKSEKNLFFSFEAGDQIIVNFKERDDDKLSEFEIIEYPTNSKFSDFKISKLENKKIRVLKRAIYQFRLKNDNRFGARICKIKIQRIADSDKTKNFDTDVVWKEITDTLKTVTQETYTIKADTSIVDVIDEKIVVHSQLDISGSKGKSIVAFSLPNNTATWSFFIGVGQEGKTAYKKAENELLKTGVKLLIGSLNPLGYFASTGISLFTNVSGQDQVYFALMGDEQSVQNFKLGGSFNQYQEGSLVSGAFKLETIPDGSRCYFGINNPNSVKPVEVNIKVTALVINKQLGTRSHENTEIKKTKKPFLSN